MDPKCEKCGAPYVKLTTTQGKDVGRKYYTCQRCRNFFMWEEHYKVCKCRGGQCKVRTETTVTNQGRPFWCCPQSTRVDNGGCGMFEWIEEKRETVSKQETGESSQCSMSSNTATATPPSLDYVKGYLRGAIRGYGHRTGMLEEVLDAVEKLDLNKP